MSDKVTVTRKTDLAMLSLRTDLAAAGDALGSALPLPVPTALRFTSDEHNTLAWLAPDEALLICHHDDLTRHTKALAAALDGTHHLITDVSDMRVCFALRGDGVTAVLSKLLPIDLHPDVFGQGHFRRTHLAQVAAAVWMPTDDQALILCFRSVATYVENALTAAADPRAAISHTGK